MSFLQILTRRLLVTPFILLGMTLIVFMITHFLPGDPTTALLGQRAMENKEIVAAFKEKWGLDKPLYVQYLTYLNNLAHGDLGVSIKTHHPITEDLGQFFPATVDWRSPQCCLVLSSECHSALFRQSSAIRQPIKSPRVFALWGFDPIFWLGLIALYVFYFWLRWLPDGAAGYRYGGTRVCDGIIFGG